MGLDLKKFPQFGIRIFYLGSLFHKYTILILQKTDAIAIMGYGSACTNSTILLFHIPNLNITNIRAKVGDWMCGKGGI
jgi:hypothetical protein